MAGKMCLSQYAGASEIAAENANQSDNEESLTPDEIISQIPVFRVVENNYHLMNNEICELCFQKFRRGEYVYSLPCPRKHKFHRYCAENWIRYVGTYCPIDRENLYQRKEQQGEEDEFDGDETFDTEQRDRFTSLIEKTITMLKFSNLNGTSDLPPVMATDCSLGPQKNRSDAGFSSQSAKLTWAEVAKKSSNKLAVDRGHHSSQRKGEGKSTDKLPQGTWRSPTKDPRATKRSGMRTTHQRKPRTKEHLSPRAAPPPPPKRSAELTNDAHRLQRCREKWTTFGDEAGWSKRQSVPVLREGTRGGGHGDAQRVFSDFLESTRLGRETVWVLKPQSFNLRYSRHFKNTSKSYC